MSFKNIIYLNYYWFLYILVLFYSAYSDETTSQSTENLLQTYRNYINASHELDKSDHMLLKVWTSDFLLQVVNVTSHYRLEVTRNKEQNFMGITTNPKAGNPKWKQYMQNEINKAEKFYRFDEGKCVRTANENSEEKKNSVFQMEKEIKKWRKSYRYLKNQCSKNNPGDEEAAGECLVEYMQKDNYHITFQRLILLKLESMSQLYNQILISLRNLEVCLKSSLKRYLTSVGVTLTEHFHLPL